MGGEVFPAAIGGAGAPCAERQNCEVILEFPTIRDEYLIVAGGKLAGAHSYSAGDATGGSEEAARFKNT